jgi:hypothetical protein
LVINYPGFESKVLKFNLTSSDTYIVYEKSNLIGTQRGFNCSLDASSEEEDDDSDDSDDDSDDDAKKKNVSTGLEDLLFKNSSSKSPLLGNKGSTPSAIKMSVQNSDSDDDSEDEGEDGEEDVEEEDDGEEKDDDDDDEENEGINNLL